MYCSLHTIYNIECILKGKQIEQMIPLDTFYVMRFQLQEKMYSLSNILQFEYYNKKSLIP